MPLIDISDLAVSFGHGSNRVAAVRGVSLAVSEGESYGIVGESGSGQIDGAAGFVRSCPHHGGQDQH